MKLDLSMISWLWHQKQRHEKKIDKLNFTKAESFVHQNTINGA